MIDSVVVWKWSRPGYRSTYTSAHVNTMRRMIARHYPHPHRFICITDDAAGIEPGIEVVDLWREFEDLRNPSYRDGPNCYVRLRSFSREFEDIAGARFVSIDLDCVITGDLTPLFHRTEDFVMYGAPGRGGWHTMCGSMWMLRTGSKSQVWETFDPRTSPMRAHMAGCKGSDQGWIKFALGTTQPMWIARDGVYSYKYDLMRFHRGRLPRGARVVVFHGKPDPWDTVALNQSPWIREHYQ